jgi:Putative bacterial sensory transduction regulator
MLDQKTLRAHLDALGWAYTERDARTLHVERVTPQGPVQVYLRLDEHWLVASVVPFLAMGKRTSFELSRWLLRMNRDMQQAKFAYDEDGDVVLALELPTESLDFSEIRAGLENLVSYAIAHRSTLRAASGAAVSNT